MFLSDGNSVRTQRNSGIMNNPNKQIIVQFNNYTHLLGQLHARACKADCGGANQPRGNSPIYL